MQPNVYVALHYGGVVGVFSTLDLAKAACQRVYNAEIQPGELKWRAGIEPEEAVGVLAGIEPDYWHSIEGSPEDPSSSAIFLMEIDGPDRA